MIDEQELLELAEAVVRENPVGLLSTVDAEGTPRSRYMGAAVGDRGLKRVLAVSAKNARKLEQINGNPRVCWVFSAPHAEEVVTLLGTASVVEQTRAMPLWERLTEIAARWSMTVLSDPENLWFIGLECRIDTVEYLNPARDVTRPQIVTLEGQGL